jgi:hypothetical protein
MVVTRTTESYDSDCRITYRRIVLDVEQVNVFPGPCSTNGACAGILVVLGLVGVGSAVVAGSIAVVGNVVHWAEHKSNCTQEPAAPQEMTPTES